MAAKKVKVSNVPNLRFPGFDGEWIRAKLENIAEKVNSGKTKEISLPFVISKTEPMKL